MDAKVKDTIVQLVNGSRDAIVCSVDEDGFPAAKAMFRHENNGLSTFWFSTNVSSIRAGHFRKNSKSCIYFFDAAGIHGVSFTGTMKVHDDDATKRRFWHEGDEKYYPLGPTDPDYCIYEFTVRKGNYYHGLQKCLFDVSEL